VLDAFTPGRREYSVDPAGLEKNRESAAACFPSQAEYQQAIAQSTPAKPTTQPPSNGPVPTPNPNGGGTSGGGFGTTSSYFRLTSFVTIGTTEFNLYSLLYMDAQGSVRPLLRSYTPD
jgi:hypothetical protein